MARMALADAQSLAIRKLLSKAVFDSTITPGPPLPKSHPSSSLIAKLHLECAFLCFSALSLMQTSAAGGSRGKIKAITLGKEGGEVTGDLKRYLSDGSSFHSALAHKWLGVDAGENERNGEAVGFLSWAKSALEDLKDGVKGGIVINKEKMPPKITSGGSFSKVWRASTRS
jgi:hypothetical protein